MPKPSRHKCDGVSSGSRSLLRRFLRDDRGIAALYIGLSSTLLFGATALAFDVGRVMSLQSELQAAADAAALAGAAELDRQSNAITRAKAAAGCPGSGVSGAFGTNNQTFATDGNGTAVSVVFCVFFSTLTTPDGALLPPNTSAQGGSATTADNAAAFIKVVVQQRSMANALITLVGGPQMASTTATATAGFSTITCKPMQLMICNPNEVAGNPFNPSPGQELFMSYSGGQAQAPGNWGLMDAPPVVSAAAQACGVTPGGNGAPVIEAYLGNAKPIGCFTTDQLITRPGKPTPVAPALNALLDMYDGSGGDPLSSTGPKATCYPPAPNVVKGYYNTTGSGCPNSGPVSNATAFPFPQDTAFTSGGLQGNGNWDITTYWANNHGGAAPTDIQSVATTYAAAQGLPSPGSPIAVTGNPYGASIPSRYATYLYELAKPAMDVANTPTGHLENGAPACYKSPNDPNITPARRLLDIGVVNCNQQAVGGRSSITPGSMLQAFMILPADGGGSNPATPGIYLEMVKKVQADSGDGLLHTVVQLYR
jgi:Flp pilus assembly protein TadG